MRYVVEPFALAGNRSRPDAVFARLDDLVDWRLEAIAQDKTRWGLIFRRFLEFLKDDIGADRFAGLQRKWLRPDALGGDPEMLKFLDLLWWFEGKLRICRRLNLDSSPPLAIVDIGAGPAHFGYLAKHFGHAIVATDLSARPEEPVLEMYDDFRALFGIACRPHVTTVHAPLPPIEERFDLCTGLLTKFHVHEDGSAWTIEDWRSFFQQLRASLVPMSGRVFFQLNEAHITPETWTFLTGLADWNQMAGRQIELRTKLHAG